jgi:hypothetical protein
MFLTSLVAERFRDQDNDSADGGAWRPSSCRSVAIMSGAGCPVCALITALDRPLPFKAALRLREIPWPSRLLRIGNSLDPEAHHGQEACYRLPSTSQPPARAVPWRTQSSGSITASKSGMSRIL